VSGELAPTGRELARRNRIVIAKRTGWPAGAVEICEAIEEAHPDWDVDWRDENPFRGFEAPAGFYATVWKALRGSGTRAPCHSGRRRDRARVARRQPQTQADIFAA
jgi:hypothetical protein